MTTRSETEELIRKTPALRTQGAIAVSENQLASLTDGLLELSNTTGRPLVVYRDGFPPTVLVPIEDEI